MTAGVAVSVEEYLRTSYSPDCDYVDGEVVERNVGEFEHSSMQREIILLLAAKFPQVRKRLLPEQRVQVKPTRFRIPDLCILSANASREKIIRTAPELCIEILSPEDTMARTLKRVKEYFDMGVPVCWIIDPEGRVAWIATPGYLDETTDGVLRAGGLEMALADVLE